MPTVLITGANRGLGLALTKHYLEAGWDVHAVARSDSEELTALDGRYETLRRHRLDVTDEQAVEGLGATLNDEAIDLLLLSAGTMGKKDFAADGLASSAFGLSEAEDFAQIYRVNAIAPMRMAETFVEQVARSEQKKIVALTSVMGSIGGNAIGGLYGYRASKAALNAIMRSMAIDLKARDIIAVPLHPGWVRTAMGGPNADLSEEEAIAGITHVIGKLQPSDSGRYLSYDGAELPW